MIRIHILGASLTWTVVTQLAAALVVVVAGSLILSHLVQKALEAWARRRGIAPEDAAVPLVRRYLMPVLLVGTLHLALSAVKLPRNLRLVVTSVLSTTTLALALYLASQIVLALLARSTRHFGVSPPQP